MVNADSRAFRWAVTSALVLLTLLSLSRGVFATALPSPVLYWPVDRSTDHSSGVTFSWSSIVGADLGYEIVVASRRDTLNEASDSGKCSGCVINETTTATSYTPAAGLLRDSTTYYWRVRARGSAFPGSWSNTAVFTTKMLDLPAPTLLSPPDGGTGQPTDLTLRWSKVEGADLGYVIMVASTPAALPRDPSATTCPDCLIATAVEGTSYAPASGTLMDSATYYWEVRGCSSTRRGGLWSAVSNFATAIVPGD